VDVVLLQTFEDYIDRINLILMTKSTTVDKLMRKIVKVQQQNAPKWFTSILSQSTINCQPSVYYCTVPPCNAQLLRVVVEWQAWICCV